MSRTSPGLTGERTRRALAAIEGPAATIGEVAAELDTTYGIARRRLRDLHEEGAVDKKKIGGRTTIWWRVE